MNLIIALVLVELNGPSGQTIFVNPDEIVSIREPRNTSSDHFAPGTRCILQTVDGKIINISDKCDEAITKLHAHE